LGIERIDARHGIICAFESDHRRGARAKARP